MTKQELDRHFELRDRLLRAEELLANLEAAAGPRSQRLDGIPRAPGVRDTAGDLAAEIADMRDVVEQLQAEVDRSAGAVESYIRTVPDFQLRQVFRLRFLRCLTWGEVAAAIGGGNSENGVKSACYRYLAKHRR